MIYLVRNRAFLWVAISSVCVASPASAQFDVFGWFKPAPPASRPVVLPHTVYYAPAPMQSVGSVPSVVSPSAVQVVPGQAGSAVTLGQASTAGVSAYGTTIVADGWQPVYGDCEIPATTQQYIPTGPSIVVPTAGPVAVQPAVRSPRQYPMQGYLPQTAYRSSWAQIPVTTYRPVTTFHPVTGTQVTTMKPCTTFQWQLRRTPVRTFLPRAPVTTYQTYSQPQTVIQTQLTSPYSPTVLSAPAVNQSSSNGYYNSTVQPPGATGNMSVPANQVPTLAPGEGQSQPHQTNMPDRSSSSGLNQGAINGSSAATLETSGTRSGVVNSKVQNSEVRPYSIPNIKVAPSVLPHRSVINHGGVNGGAVRGGAVRGGAVNGGAVRGIQPKQTHTVRPNATGNANLSSEPRPKAVPSTAPAESPILDPEPRSRKKDFNVPPPLLNSNDKVASAIRFDSRAQLARLNPPPRNKYKKNAASAKPVRRRPSVELNVGWSSGQ